MLIQNGCFNLHLLQLNSISQSMKCLNQHICHIFFPTGILMNSHPLVMNLFCFVNVFKMLCVLLIYLVFNLFCHSIRLNFYFMKTANIPVYGNIAVYINQCVKMLRIHLFFTIKTPQALAALMPLGLLIVKTLTLCMYS